MRRSSSPFETRAHRPASPQYCCGYDRIRMTSMAKSAWGKRPRSSRRPRRGIGRASRATMYSAQSAWRCPLSARRCRHRFSRSRIRRARKPASRSERFRPRRHADRMGSASFAFRPTRYSMSKSRCRCAMTARRSSHCLLPSSGRRRNRRRASRACRERRTTPRARHRIATKHSPIATAEANRGPAAIRRHEARRTGTRGRRRSRRSAISVRRRRKRPPVMRRTKALPRPARAKIGQRRRALGHRRAPATSEAPHRSAIERRASERPRLS